LGEQTLKKNAKRSL